MSWRVGGANAHSLDGSMALRIADLDSGVCYCRGLDTLAIPRRGGCGNAPRRGHSVRDSVAASATRTASASISTDSAAGEYALGKLVLVAALKRCAVLMVWLSVTAGAWHFSGRARALRVISARASSSSWKKSASLFQTFFSG